MQVVSQGMSIVVLAAGLGSRFGGTKQLAAVGPNGESILDYTLFDARRAGFDDVVLIIRRELEDLVTAHLRQHHDALDARFAYQDELGPQRAKPWGTGHAVLAAAPLVQRPFAVVNADDFYGRRPIEQLASALRRPEQATNRHYLMAYELAQTLSESGTVSRGVCSTAADGRLEAIVENLAIARDAQGRIVSQDSGLELAPDTPVSLNLWGLQPSLFTELDDAWSTFLLERGDDPKAEFQLPTVIHTAIASGRATVQVERTGAPWMGVTYPDDIHAVRQRVAELVADGTYPSPLR